VKLYTQAAERGRAQAQVNLGYCYEKGIGCVQDDARAARLFRQAAEQGDSSGQFALGDCYRTGAGVEQNLALAALGVRLEKGRGVAQSEAEAATSYAAASELGGADGLFASGAEHLTRSASGAYPSPLPSSSP